MWRLWRAHLHPCHTIKTVLQEAGFTTQAASSHGHASMLVHCRNLIASDASLSQAAVCAPSAADGSRTGVLRTILTRSYASAPFFCPFTRAPARTVAALISSPSSLSSFSTAALAVSAPKPLPKYKRPYKGELKWKKMVIRFPSSVEAQMQDRNLRISGPAGVVTLNLKHMDPTGLVAMDFVPAAAGQSSSMLLCVSPSKRNFQGINTHINNAIYGVTQGYLVGVTVKGVGYRFEAVDNPLAGKQFYFEPPAAVASNAVYPHPKPVSAVRLKVGFTGSAVYQFPDYVRCFVIQPTLMYLYGLQLDKVKSIAKQLCMVKKPNAYTGNGLRLTTETLRLKSKSGGK